MTLVLGIREQPTSNAISSSPQFTRLPPHNSRAVPHINELEEKRLHGALINGLIHLESISVISSRTKNLLLFTPDLKLLLKMKKERF